MAKRPSKFNSAKLLQTLANNDKYIAALAAKRKVTLGRNIKKMAGKAKDKKAEEHFAKQRAKGMNMNQLIACCDKTRRFNAVRDRVTIVSVKVSKNKEKITSRSLTYDKTSGILKVRPHRHTVEINPSAGGELYNVSFSKAKRLLVGCDCLVGETKVLTDLGWKTIHEIAEPYIPGRYSINYMFRGQMHLGTAPYYKGIQHTWSITLENDVIVTATQDHKFLKEIYKTFLFETFKNLEWIMLKDLKINDKLVLDSTKGETLTIKHIEYAGEQKVYDITVPLIEMFVIDGGIIVHNCEDWMYRWEYAMDKRWGASNGIKFGNSEYPIETNPSLNAGICKHLRTLLIFLKQRGY